MTQDKEAESYRDRLQRIQKLNPQQLKNIVRDPVMPIKTREAAKRLLAGR